MNRFNGICLITKDVERLASFYSEILQVGTVREGDNITFLTKGAELTIFSLNGMEQMAPGSMEGAGYGSFTVEIEVENVDHEYNLLSSRGVCCVKLPETYPWGRRSAWFRDPDGNLVNLFSLVINHK